MQTEDFSLKSGAVLHVSSGPWNLVVPLWSAVKLVTIGQTHNPEVGHLILASEAVQKCIAALFPFATYQNLKVYPGLFDEQEIGERARGDFLEICERILEFQLRPFFLMSSSRSMDQKTAPIANPEQP